MLYDAGTKKAKLGCLTSSACKCTICSARNERSVSHSVSENKDPKPKTFLAGRGPIDSFMQVTGGKLDVGDSTSWRRRTETLTVAVGKGCREIGNWLITGHRSGWLTCANEKQETRLVPHMKALSRIGTTPRTVPWPTTGKAKYCTYVTGKGGN